MGAPGDMGAGAPMPEKAAPMPKDRPPRALRVSPDGGAVTFLRTRSGDDPVSCLWQADAASGEERLVADPRALGADDENLSPQERARRERVRETGSGIVAYATDERHTLAVFALS